MSDDNKRNLGDDNLIFRPEEAAVFLGVSDWTLKNWRMSGDGPKFIRLASTRVGYRKGALLKFIREREFQSTSEEKAGKPQPSSDDAGRSDEP